MEDTSEIDDGDDLVLRTAGQMEVKQEGKKEEVGTTVAATVVRTVEDPHVFAGRRIAKYFAVDGEKELVLYFGRVGAHYSSEEDGGEW